MTSPKIKRKFDLLSDCSSIDDVKEVLDDLKETEIWELFDGIKEKYRFESFWKRLICIASFLTPMIFDVDPQITDKAET
jgi:hypothetical protein